MTQWQRSSRSPAGYITTPNTTHNTISPQPPGDTTAACFCWQAPPGILPPPQLQLRHTPMITCVCTCCCRCCCPATSLTSLLLLLASALPPCPAAAAALACCCLAAAAAAGTGTPGSRPRSAPPSAAAHPAPPGPAERVVESTQYSSSMLLSFIQTICRTSAAANPAPPGPARKQGQQGQHPQQQL